MRSRNKNKVFAVRLHSQKLGRISKENFFCLVEQTFVAGREGSSEPPEPPLGTGLEKAGKRAARTNYR